jgi:Bifunctional DNA primase/polymerase, N-terminal
VFVLSPSKTPVANCAPCRAEHNTPTQMEACECLACHGFHAATLDRDCLAQMLRQYPRGLLAIRTGAPSGIVVIDVDPPGIGTMKVLVGDGILPRTGRRTKPDLLKRMTTT